MRFAIIAAAALAASTASAEIVRTEANGSMSEVIDNLEATVTEAGAKVFARVPHSKGAASVDMELNDAELLIFGNPQLGTPALQDDIHAGLMLPLRVLVYTDDEGQTWIAYEDVDAMFDGLDMPGDAIYREKMRGALANFANKAAN